MLLNKGHFSDLRSAMSWRGSLEYELSVLLDIHRKWLSLPHFPDDDPALGWLLDQLSPEEREEWCLEAAFLETLYGKYDDEYEMILEADRIIEAGLMPSEAEIDAMLA